MSTTPNRYVLIRVGQLPKPFRVEVTPSSFTGRPNVGALRSRLLAEVNEALQQLEAATSPTQQYLPYRNCRILRRGVELRDDRPIEPDTFTPDEHLQVLLTDRQQPGTEQGSTQPTASDGNATFPVLGSGRLSVLPPALPGGQSTSRTATRPREGGHPSLQGQLTQQQIETLRGMFITALLEQNQQGSPNTPAAQGQRSEGQAAGGTNAAGENQNGPADLMRRVAAIQATRQRRRGSRSSGSRTVGSDIPRPGTTAAPTRLVEGETADPDGATDNRLRLRDLIIESMKEPWWRFFLGAALGFVFIPSIFLLVFSSTAKKVEKQVITGQHVRYRQGPTSEERKKARAANAEGIKGRVDKIIANESLVTSSTNDAIISIPPPTASKPLPPHREAPAEENEGSAVLHAKPTSVEQAPRTPLAAPVVSNVPFFALRDTSTQQSTALHDWSVSSGLIRFRFGIFVGVVMNLVVGMVTAANVNSLVASN